jgi:hypothetical protein
MSAAEATVVHAYGLVPAGQPLSLPEGIDGAAVTEVRVGSIVALASELSTESYGPDVWRAHAEDPKWLEQVASRHHAVLQEVVGQADVLPLRLPGIHQDLATLQQVLRDQLASLEHALERIRGHVELGAKVFLVNQTTQQAEAEQRPTSGRDYLARRSAEASNREEARLRRQKEVLDAHEAMAHGSTHAAVNAPQDAALSGRSEPMLLNAAYLVPRDGLDEFVALAERVHDELARDGMTLEVTGPWPPYNFADVADGSRVGQDR